CPRIPVHGHGHGHGRETSGVQGHVLAPGSESATRTPRSRATSNARARALATTNDARACAPNACKRSRSRRADALLPLAQRITLALMSACLRADPSHVDPSP